MKKICHLCFLFLLLCQTSDAKENRLALVMGNSNYTNAYLSNPANDAKAIAKKLKKLGFAVILKINKNQKEMEDAITNFGERLAKNGGTGLFFYAGHGVQSKGQNYLIPIGADIKKERNLRYKTVNIDRVLNEMRYAQNDLNILILDACRNNPLSRSNRSVKRGMARLETENVPSILIAYATAPGDVAEDGENKHSPYTQALLENIDKPGWSIEKVFKTTSKSVQAQTHGQQIPWISSSITQDFEFNPSKSPILVAGAGTGIADSQENRFWDSINKTDIDELKDYLSEYPQGHYARIARTRIKKIQKKEAPAPVIPQKARLTIRSNVYGDEVWLNGENKGTTRLDLKLNAGIYDLVIKKAGYEDYQRELQLTAGQAQVVYGRLTPKPAETTPYQAPIQRQSNANQGKRISHYIVYNNGTVKDIKTGLIWKRCAEGLSGADCSQGKAIEYTWQKAMDHAKQVRFAGHSDWRLPTIEELRTLVYCSNGVSQERARHKSCSGLGWSIYDKNPYQRPAINQIAFPQTKSSYYWSASSFVSYPTYAWYVGFYNGNVNAINKSNNLRVRLVRGGQSL